MPTLFKLALVCILQTNSSQVANWLPQQSLDSAGAFFHQLAGQCSHAVGHAHRILWVQSLIFVAAGVTTKINTPRKLPAQTVSEVCTMQTELVYHDNVYMSIIKISQRHYCNIG